MKMEQRLGQFIYNMLRPSEDSGPMSIDSYRSWISEKLWNMANEELIEIITGWNHGKTC